MESIDTKKLSHLTMLLPLASLVGGILLARFGASFIIGFAVIIFGLLLGTVLHFLSATPARALTLNPFQPLWMVLIFIGAGISIYNWHLPVGLHNQFSDPGKCNATVSATVLEISTINSGDKILVDIHRHTHDKSRSANEKDNVRNIKAWLYCSPLAVRPGDIISFPCKIKNIEDSPNTLRSGYARNMRNSGIYYTISLYDKDMAKVHIRRPAKTPLRAYIYDINSALHTSIENSNLERDTRDFLLAILLADRPSYDADSSQILADAGLSHILSLSGMHIAIVAGIFLWLLFPMHFLGVGKLKYPITVIILWAYVFITGAAPSTIRAAFMTSFIFAAILLQRDKSSLNALFAASFVILIFNPNALFNAGMQLSVTAVAALILFSEWLNPIQQHLHHHTYSIVGTLLTPIIATAATCMLTAYYFGRIPMMFFIVNIVAIPLLPIFVVAALIFLIFSAISVNIPFLGDILDLSVHSLYSFASLASDAGSRVINLSPHFITPLLWTAFLIAAACMIHYRKSVTAKIATISLFVCSIVSVPLFAAESPENLVIIHNRSDIVAFSCYSEGAERVVNAVPHTPQVLKINDKIFLIADGISDDGDIEHLQSLLGKYGEKCDALIITSGCYAGVEALRAIDTGMVIMHPSLNTRKEQRLTRDFQHHHIHPHSLRTSGPLHLQCAMRNAQCPMRNAMSMHNAQCAMRNFQTGA